MDTYTIPTTLVRSMDSNLSLGQQQAIITEYDKLFYSSLPPIMVRQSLLGLSVILVYQFTSDNLKKLRTILVNLLANYKLSAKEMGYAICIPVIVEMMSAINEILKLEHGEEVQLHILSYVDDSHFWWERVSRDLVYPGANLQQLHLFVRGIYDWATNPGTIVMTKDETLDAIDSFTDSLEQVIDMLAIQYVTGDLPEENADPIWDNLYAKEVSDACQRAILAVQNYGLTLRA